MFDEAAGIVKIQAPQNAFPEKSWKEEQNNLTRVSDILSELEKQIGPLEKQSAVAKEYLKKKEELKVYDIHMFLLETERFKRISFRVWKKKSGLLLMRWKRQRVAMKKQKNNIRLWRHRWKRLMQRSKIENQLNETTLFEAAAGRTDQCFKRADQYSQDQ